MRQIIFRGKLSHSEKQWVEGNLIIARNGQPYIIPFDVFEPDGHHLIIDSDNPFWVKPETVCQSIEMVDENNKVIFEGDILKSIFHGRDGDREIIGVVEIDKCNPCFVIHYKYDGNGHNCYEYDFVQAGLRENEIIGNIFDNPELFNDRVSEV